ncbi:MAG TPA: peptide chain release factor 1 [Acetobacteraceae bacterium]|nr:peptide chain release factor 1 [Acetobacteraceae bacterium]
MTEIEYARKLDELDRLLNDPDVPMEPEKVWSLLAEIAQRDLAAVAATASVPSSA